MKAGDEDKEERIARQKEAQERADAKREAAAAQRKKDLEDQKQAEMLKKASSKR